MNVLLEWFSGLLPFCGVNASFEFICEVYYFLLVDFLKFGYHILEALWGIGYDIYGV